VNNTEGRYHIFNPKRNTIPITMNAATSISSQNVTYGYEEGEAYKCAAASMIAKLRMVNLRNLIFEYPPVIL
jgi:hypothetical protein